MLKSLYSGVTGMRSQQTKMDVIANNIANVSTTGFKTGRVRFQDLISQIDSPAQGPTANRGGSNAQQIGLGVQVSGTDTIMTSGSLQTTGRPLDFGIQNGDNSFFVVGEPGANGQQQYSRDGGFFADAEGALVTASGMYVLGYTTNGPVETGEGKITVGTGKANLNKLVIHGTLASDGKVVITANPDTDISLESFDIDNTGTIIGRYSNGKSYELGRVALANFANPDGLRKAGGNLYKTTPNANPGEQPTLGASLEAGFGEISSGFLEMSNVDLANEFTEMIVTNRAYQANSRAITTSDEILQELLNLKR